MAGKDSLSVLSRASDYSAWLSFLADTNCIDESEIEQLAQNILSVGFLANGVAQSDAVVPVSSAQGLRKDGDTVAAFNGRELQQDEVEMFDHLSVGYEPGALGENSRGLRLREFIDAGVLPWFDDHVVVVTKEGPGFSLPTEDSEGFVHAVYLVDFNVNRGDLSGVLAVTYGSYKDNENVKRWTVLQGARVGPTGKLEPDLSVDNDGFSVISGNSRVGPAQPVDLFVDFTMPKVNPSVPETRIEELITVIMDFGEGKDLVIEGAPGGGFGVP